MLLPLIDPTWAVVGMLLAFVLGLIGGVRMTAHGYNTMNRMPPR